MEVERRCEVIETKLIYSNNEEDMPPKLQESIDSIIKKEGYLTNRVYKRSVSTNGGNYLGDLYEIDVEGTTPEGHKEINIFVKNIISGEHFDKMFSLTGAYAKELFAYKELSKVFKEVQDEADVPEEERYKMPRGYEESYSDAIIMENLAKKGFTTCYRMDVVPLKFAELSVQQLAKFHGLSFVLERKRSKYFETNIKTKTVMFRFNDDFHEFITKIYKTVIQDLDCDLREKIEDNIPNLIKKYEQYFKDDSCIRCLCHGDYRANNILMKKTAGKIEEIIPVDYQLIFYGCPIMDFAYFIFGATDRQFRREHLTDLKNLYFETLKNFLKYFDLNVEEVYPRKEFEKMYKEKLDYGLMSGLMISAFIFAPEDDVPDMSQDMLTINFSVDKRCTERVKGLVEDFIQWGYL